MRSRAFSTEPTLSRAYSTLLPTPSVFIPSHVFYHDFRRGIIRSKSRVQRLGRRPLRRRRRQPRRQGGEALFWPIFGTYKYPNLFSPNNWDFAAIFWIFWVPKTPPIHLQTSNCLVDLWIQARNHQVTIIKLPSSSSIKFVNIHSRVSYFSGYFEFIIIKFLLFLDMMLNMVIYIIVYMISFNMCE